MKITQSINVSRHKRRCDKKLSPPAVTVGSTSILCEICSKNFKNKETLRVHIYNCHSAERSGDFACSTCSSVYKSKGQLLKHVKIKHGPFTRFPCQLCDYSCLSKNGLGRHFNRVHSSNVDSNGSGTDLNTNENTRSSNSSQLQSNFTECQNTSGMVEGISMPIVSTVANSDQEGLGANILLSVQNDNSSSAIPRERVLDFSEF